MTNFVPQQPSDQAFPYVLVISRNRREQLDRVRGLSIEWRLAHRSADRVNANLHRVHFSDHPEGVMSALISQQQQSSLSVVPYLLVVRYVLPCVVTISTLGAIVGMGGGLWVTPMGGA